MSENSKFGNFWAISMCNISKERIFHIEFNFKQKKFDLFEKKEWDIFPALNFFWNLLSYITGHTRKFENWYSLIDNLWFYEEQTYT